MTDAERHARAVSLFLDALDRPEGERESWVMESAESDALRDDVLGMLRAHDTHDEDTVFLDRPVFDQLDAALPEVQGKTVGPWRILDRLGAGGMGVVYRAERGDGLYERTVALKLLAPAALLSTGEDLTRRLAAERQILARLEHDGIARLYDGGLTDDGLPWLALELVDGEPITIYAERHGLDVRARAALFARACDAVAYAHRNLVVHRDLKPDHIRIVETERGPGIKLLDFGVSALLGDPTGSGLTLPTVSRALTPAYAAPEQVRGEPITTASDLYALGVVLYELLAGQRPYDLSGLTASGIERTISEVEPPPPSAIAPPERVRALRGDLDTIVMKALAKEPERRYAGVEALADDLRRHLDGRPVEARPATAGYRAGRFIRRHRLGVGAAALVALALLIGIGIALSQARIARAEAAKAEAANDFLLGLLGAANPHESGRDVRVASLLDQAAEDLDAGFADQPELEAENRQTLGITYRELGLYDEAVEQFDRALALSERLYGSRHPEVAFVQHSLGIALQELGEFEKTDSLFTLALATLRDRYGEQNTHVSTLLNDLGHLHNELGETEEAEALYRQSLAIEEGILEPDALDHLIGLGNLGVVMMDQGKDDEAAELFVQQIEGLRRSHPEAKESLGNALSNLGTVRFYQDRGEEAAELQAEAVALFRDALGDEHDYLGFALSNLGSTLGYLGRHAEAEPTLREAVAVYSAAVGEDHPNVGFPLVNLAKTLRELDQLDEADAAARRAVTLFRDGFGPEHFAVGRALTVRGEIFLDRGRTTEAVVALREALEVFEASLPPEHADRAATQSLLGGALLGAGRADEAAPLLETSYATLDKALGPDHKRTRSARERLAMLYEATGREAEASALVP